MKTTNKYYNRLKELQQKHPLLTFQNDGYQKLPKDIQKDYIEQITEIESILKETFAGFKTFNNFKIRQNGDIVIRLQYDYNHDAKEPSFVGVGYFKIDLWANYELSK